VLPDANNSPTCVPQYRISLLITADISVHFGNPILDVGSWLAVVDGAPVPEAAIDEHCDLRSRKDDVGGAANVGYWAPCDAVPQAASMQDRAQR
jgi:hypothetical protein